MSVATMRARLGATAAIAVVSATALVLVPTAATATPSASAAPRAHAVRHQSAARVHQQKVHRVIAVTRRQKGKPYSYGAAGPHSFDCSGLVRYVFLKAVDRSLPHNAAAQMHSSQRIWHRRNLEVGDLVFETSGSGYAYHVGIYAGHGEFWNAPHSGTVVKKQRMYHARWRFGRIIR